jgi:hypothetical protein
MSEPNERYRSLQLERVVDTAARLEKRIGERFPDAGLRNVARELRTIAGEAIERAAKFRRPHLGLRFVAFVLLAGLVAGVVAAAANVDQDREHWRELFHPDSFVQTIESGLAIVVFLGAAIVFLASLEQRWKRKKALEAVRQGPATPSSPKRLLTPFLLSRYLDYCSELLSLVSKVAAMYVQDFPDREALAAVDQLTSLTNELSGNIWQKMNILDRAAEWPARTSDALATDAISPESGTSSTASPA